MSQLPEDQLLCGRFRRRAPGLGHAATPALRPFDPLLPVKDEISGRDAWLLPLSANFVGTEIDRSYFMMGATQSVQLQVQRAIAPAFVDRDEHWFWLGYWADDLQDHGLSGEAQDGVAIVQWAHGVAKNLEELHQLGKQHGLLQPGAVVRDAQGVIRVWGGAVYELLNKVRLAVKAKQDGANQETLFVPAVLEGAPLTLQDELAGWAMTVASRWFNASGQKALVRLEAYEAVDSWGADLKRLVSQCLQDPLGQGISSARDLATRLEVICDAVRGPGLLNERRMQAFAPTDTSMPSLESIQVSAHDPMYSAIVPARPLTSANSAPAARLGTSPRTRSTTSRDVTGVDASTWNPPAPSGELTSTPPRKWPRALAWIGGALFLMVAGGAGWAWSQGLWPAGSNAQSEASEPVDTGGQATQDQASGALADACPDHAARLPGGTCMDRFEYPGEGHLPRVSLTKNQAALLCEARKGRLCQTKEWMSACTLGKANLAGCQLRAGRKDRSRLRPASKSDCVHAGEFYDLVGNAAEWVSEGSARGGDAKTLRSKASCKDRVRGKKASSRGFSVGFRCCYGEPEPAPPQSPKTP